jgi:hypothetical protein
VPVKLRSDSTTSTPYLRLVYSAAAPGESIAAKINRFTMPATKSLPFVKVRANDQPFWRPESFWHVESTGRRDADIQLGRKYARLTIAAMKADRDQHLVAHIIHDIIKDAAKKPGKSSGVRSPISLGFLTELSEVIAAEP